MSRSGCPAGHWIAHDGWRVILEDYHYLGQNTWQLSLFIYLWVCRCAVCMFYTCMCGCTYLCMHVQRSEVNLRHLSPLLFTFYFQIKYFENLKFIDPSRLASEPLESSHAFLLSTEQGLWVCVALSSFSCGCCGSKLRFLCFYKGHLTRWNISTAQKKVLPRQPHINGFLWL